MGSIIDIVDSSGTLVQHHIYDTFGTLAQIKDNSGIDVTAAPPLKPFYSYTNRELDVESGLYYYRTRYYDSSIGRFIEEDPVAGTQGDFSTVVNKYSYAVNNPLNFTDAFGEFVCGGLCVIGLSALAGGIIGEFTTDNSFFENMLQGAALGSAFIGVGALIGAGAGAFSGGAAGGVAGLMAPSAGAYVASGVLAAPAAVGTFKENSGLGGFAKAYSIVGAIGNFAQLATFSELYNLGVDGVNIKGSVSTNSVNIEAFNARTGSLLYQNSNIAHSVNTMGYGATFSGSITGFGTRAAADMYAIRAILSLLPLRK